MSLCKMNTDNLCDKPEAALLKKTPKLKVEIKSEPETPFEHDSEVEFADWRIKTEEVVISDMETDNEPDFDSTTISPGILQVNLHVDFNHEAPPAPESYCCELCSQIFDNKKSLVKHVKGRCFSEIFHRHLKSPPVTQNVQKSSAGKKVIPCPKGKQHKTAARKIAANVNCPQCDRKFKALSALKEHMPVHTGERNFPCDICSKSFTTGSTRNRHKLTHGPKFRCSICEIGFRCRSDFRKHMAYHSGVKAFECVKCKKKFKTLRRWEKHTKTHNVKKTATCSVCNKTFANKNNLIKHMTVHDAVKKYPCQLCDKRFGIKNHRRLHILTVHGTVVKQFECDICKKMFAIKDYIRRHIAVHDEENRKACYICGNRFTRIGDRDRHMLKHEVGREQTCKVCGEVFLSGDSLEWHVKTNHKKIENLECPKCKKTFTASRYLKEHLALHTDLRGFECPECEKTFTAARYLKQHLLVHSGVKDFECSVCHKFFNNQSNRNKHERMHALRK